MKTPAGGEAERVREYALLLLSYRERTEKEMTERLGRKGFPPAAVAATVADCRRLGLIDDERFARHGARRPRCFLGTLCRCPRFRSGALRLIGQRLLSRRVGRRSRRHGYRRRRCRR